MSAKFEKSCTTISLPFIVGGGRGGNGQVGPPGPPGPPGPAGTDAVTNFGGFSLPLNGGPVVVADAAAVPFSVVGTTSTPTTITLNVANGQFTIGTAGIYRVSWIIPYDSAGGSEFSLAVDTVPIAASAQGSSADQAVNGGQWVVSVTAGQVLTVVNTNGGDTTLDILGNATINIIQLA